MNTATLRGKDVPCVATHQRSFTTFYSNSTVDEGIAFRILIQFFSVPATIKAVERGRTQ